MIFVTVGTQLPFPRLVAHLDQLAARLDEKVIAQTGEARAYEHLDAFASCSALDIEHFCDAARVIVAHAGMGSVLMARRLGKPLIILPRQRVSGEHRNDHQMATAQALEGRAGIRVAWDEAEIGDLLAVSIEPPDHGPNTRYTGLLDTLRDFAAAS